MLRESHISENQTRLFLSLDEMPDIPTFEALFEYWLARRGHDSSLPTTDGFNPAAVMSEDQRPWLASVNVEANNPYGFVFESHAPSDSFNRIAGKALGQFPDAEHADSLADEFLFVKQRALPRFDRIEHIVGLWHRHYERLAVPVVCGKTRQVVRVYTTVNRLEPSRAISSTS